MKIKNGYVLEPVGGAFIAVAVGGEASANALVRMNGTGAFLWRLLEEEQTVESLLAAMLKEYEVSEEIALRDITAFVKKLSDSGILAE